MASDVDPANEMMETDILIIGSGIAGFLAAVQASEKVDNILLVTKGCELGVGGASTLAIYPFSSCVTDSRSARDLGFPGSSEDSPEIFFRDIIQAGRFLGDQKQVERFVGEIPRVLELLTTLGFQWDYSRLDRIGGHSFPRDCYGARYHGIEFIRTIRRVLRELRQFTVLADVLMLDILTSHEESLELRD